MAQRSPKDMQHRSGALVPQSQAHEAEYDVKNEYNGQSNEFLSTFNYESFDVMKKQLSFLQEELKEKRRRIELEMRHSQSDQIRSTSKPIEVKRSVPPYRTNNQIHPTNSSLSDVTPINNSIAHQSPQYKQSIKPCKPKTFEGNLNENALLWVNAMQRYL